MANNRILGVMMAMGLAFAIGAAPAAAQDEATNGDSGTAKALVKRNKIRAKKREAMLKDGGTSASAKMDKMPAKMDKMEAPAADKMEAPKADKM